MSNKILDDIKKDIVITVKLSTDKIVKKLNKKYLKRDYPTDVLSFDIKQDEGDNYYLGDIIVNIDKAKKQANNNTFEEEVAELASHGILHLLGVHHEDDDDNSVHGIKKVR